MSIDGGEGNDVVCGSDTDETIFGGLGNDTIFGGIGVDSLYGGVGADEFQFTKTSQDTSVLDFNPVDGDTLVFFNNGGAIFDEASIEITDIGVIIAYVEAGRRHEVNNTLALSATDFFLVYRPDNDSNRFHVDKAME